jgi:hypothetical protein
MRISHDDQTSVLMAPEIAEFKVEGLDLHNW